MKNFLLFLFMTGIYLTSFSQSQRILLKDWQVQSSEKSGNKGEVISSENLNKKGWIRANVPTTVLNAQMENGAYKDIFIGKNIEKVDTRPFKNAWWYRTEFNMNDLNKIFLLKFEGINYSAEIWLNGKKIASKEEVINPFRQYKYPVNKYLRKGKNILAVKVYPPKPGDYTIGFVDWNPAPPDNNMGIFRDVLLISNNGVSIEDPYIESSFKNGNYKETDLIFTTYLQNFNKEISGDLRIKIGDIAINKKVTLKKGEQKKITLTSKDFKQLHLKNPILWWPHTLGTPELYHAKVQFFANGKEIDSQEFDFGIREVSQYFTKEGHRGFKINGEKISIRGGGWVDHMTLNDTPDYIKAQLEYVKDMNLNTIRLEGFWGKDQTMYNLCDQMGILVMVGWSCHWEWENYLGKPTDETYGGITSPQDIEMMSKAWKDQIVWLRNHPSIFAWSAGSDCIPKPELEKKYFDIFHKYDSTRAYLQSAKEWTSLAGPSGVKMRGPYAYVPPVYWYKDTLYGGAFGFNTETGPGAQVPPLESIKRMIPEKDLWPINDVWDFHCGRNEFNTLSRFTEALNKRYGEAKNVEEYAFKAQMLNYELMRPMFEAFSINRYKATGVIQWMLNSAWPEMYWQLYDTYLMPNGAYYATKKAGKPIQAMYNYGDNSVYLVNDQLKNSTGLKLQIKVYDIHSKVLFAKDIKTDLPANSSKKVIELPEISGLTDTYFLSLKIINNSNREITDNFYWLSRKKDILDYKAKVPSWYYHTPSKQYADFTQLNELKPVKLSFSVIESNEGEYQVYNVELKNTTHQIAFFTELRLIDTMTNASILPVLWSDNYISLLPGETHQYKAKIKKNLVLNKKVKFTFRGWKVKE